MDALGVLKEKGDRFEFHFEDLGLVIRGRYAEWVLAAASEIIAKVARLEAESKLDELNSLVEFGEVDQIDLDAAKFDMKSRFEVLPQCVVSMGSMDYRWADKEARERLVHEFDGHTLKRLVDMSMTRNDSFLQDEDPDAQNLRAAGATE